MKALEKYLILLGMVGVMFYFLHTILGNILLTEYNPITTDISSLTADGAPHASLLKIFSLIYGICMILMVFALIRKAFRKYNRILRVGYVTLFTIQLFSTIGYSLFPLTGDKTQMNFQNMMHIVVTVFGMLNPISKGLQLNILGLTERMVIYTIQIFMFILSYYYTFLAEESGWKLLKHKESSHLL